jgi:Cytochrome P460
VSPRPAFFPIAVLLVAACAIMAVTNRPPSTALAAADITPAYAQNGDMLPPAGYREWIYLSSGIDMSYTPNSAATQDHSVFDNVFVDPAAYRSYRDSGTWPDKTVFVLEVREAQSKGSINLTGHYQGAGVMSLEVHVKDRSRFPGEWAFFSFHSMQANGKLFPQDANCYSCHVAHGAVDTTFVQFYPTLLPIARAKGTLSANFLKESAGAAPGR